MHRAPGTATRKAMMTVIAVMKIGAYTTTTKDVKVVVRFDLGDNILSMNAQKLSKLCNWYILLSS